MSNMTNVCVAELVATDSMRRLLRDLFELGANCAWKKHDYHGAVVLNRQALDYGAHRDGLEAYAEALYMAQAFGLAQQVLTTLVSKCDTRGVSAGAALRLGDIAAKRRSYVESTKWYAKA